VEERHRRIAQLALAAAGRFSLALAGGYAIQVHGIGSRPSGDVDLFVNWACRDDFDDAVSAVTGALEKAGMKVEVVARAETFARLLVTDPAAGGEPDKVEVAADWRAHEPVMLDVGPVLHSDDAVANKMAALYGRALARDFLDIDAILTSGRYSRERLLDLAAAADDGFDRHMFADALGALTQITDAAFAEYGPPAQAIADLRHRFAAWRDDLLAS
jgi:Nucleotidyl transferase AbiEii toxin, Type IV TA system